MGNCIHGTDWLPRPVACGDGLSSYAELEHAKEVEQGEDVDVTEHALQRRDLEKRNQNGDERCEARTRGLREGEDENQTIDLMVPIYYFPVEKSNHSLHGIITFIML